MYVQLSYVKRGELKYCEGTDIMNECSYRKVSVRFVLILFDERKNCWFSEKLKFKPEIDDVFAEVISYLLWRWERLNNFIEAGDPEQSL